jgi:GNAT superfamily N-acetyltransferase
VNAPAARFTGEVRPPRPQDFARMADLASQLGYDAAVGDIARRLDGMRHSKEHAVFVAELPDGEIAGWIGVFIYRGVELDARAEISGLIVDERFRSQNVGLRLLERAEQRARDNGCTEASLRSNVIRDRAHKFYERNGYTHTKTQKSFRKKL